MNESLETPPSIRQGRLCIALAALFWSTSGAFTKVLTLDTPFHLNEPPVDSRLIACLRVLFAGVVLLPLLRRRDITFRPMMLVMVACFAVMNYLFVRAMAEGDAASAIYLQYTAPMWMFLASVWWLGERADARSFTALAIGVMGILAIVLGGWQGGKLDVVAMGLGSGVTYAGVVIALRVLRDASSRWLTALNLLFSGLVLLPFVLDQPSPTPAQLIVLFFYGAAQMTVPYWLMARGVRAVSPQEAGTITLLEPLLNPLWAYLISGEKPTEYVLIGGGCILGALAWRYWPRKSEGG
ncbi:MAG: DMT family transporter [Gemmataceae bacterium]|nr:DMT family transporter [Gemmataceae bacterium]